MVDVSSIIEGTVKFRDGKKWKSRWCVMRKLSPVADCLHLQLYRDSKERYKNGQTKSSLSLEHFLGVESGFHLDKESNTIAIICEDVIVVLAFDTRERLIQWQVKISTNLGDDIQYLVLVSSSPQKAKISSGPARMHIQDHRFCLTTGVPPKLSGLWKIGYLRRYGVVDGRFCFEGGSSCGKGEGLYVFVTDQSDEITHTLKLASQGRLISKKRPLVKKSKMPELIHEESCLLSNDDSSNSHVSCTCAVRNTLYWPSQESRDTNYECSAGDNVSVLENNDVFNMEHDTMRTSFRNMSRCMSCMSKLGGPSMSRSSTITGTPCTEHNPSFPIIDNQNSCSQKQLNQIQILDCLSLDSHGSSNSSDYSMPKPFQYKMKQSQSVMNSNWYERDNPSAVRRKSITCQCYMTPPNRPPKFNSINSKPPMPLPATATFSNSFIGPYENYDVPKIPHTIEIGENYDTPKAVSFSNYDTPILPGKNDENQQPHTNCTCQRIISWNCMTLPYCLRGNSVDETGMDTQTKQTKKLPVIDQQARSIAIYATVDKTRKICRKLAEEERKLNYVNFDFEKSLENYENSKEMLNRVHKSNPQLNIMEKEKHHEIIKVCHLCLSHSNSYGVKRNGISCENLTREEVPDKDDDYMMMEPDRTKVTLQGYTPMVPVTSETVDNDVAPPLPSKSDILKRLLNEKSASNPSLRDNLNQPNKLPSQCCDHAKLDRIENESELEDGSTEESQASQKQFIRRSISIPFNKGHNRDSSSSNDSGVSITSLKNHANFVDLELPMSNSITVKKYQKHILPALTCVHSSLPRRSKSFDPLREISFQFQQIKIPEKSTSAEAEVPVCSTMGEGSSSSTSHPTYVDSRSTSSGTSDMSDYIETLSYSSHSSSDTAEALRLIRHQPTSTLRPRSGKEYHNIDRSLLSLTQSNINHQIQSTTSLRNLCLGNYANITPVPEIIESISLGYQNCGDTKDESKDNQPALGNG